MFRPKGYYTDTDYVGFLPGNNKMRFASESEYMDYLCTLLPDDDSQIARATS